MIRFQTIARFLLILTAFGQASCRNLYDAKRPYQVYEKPAAYFGALVNPETKPAKTLENESEIVLENPEYPIELKLYKDKTFHYHLARLGDGTGTWKYQDGHLELYAERKLFVMQMEMHSTSPEEKEEAIALEFSDRFGPKFLPLDRK